MLVPLLLPFLLYMAIPRFSATHYVRNWLERELSTEQVRVRLGSFRLGYDLALHAVGVQLFEPDSKPFLTVRSIRTRPDWTSLPDLSFGVIQMESPELHTARLPREQQSGDITPRILRIQVHDGTIYARSDAAGEVVLGPFDTDSEFMVKADTVGMRGRVAAHTLGLRSDLDVRFRLADRELEAEVDLSAETFSELLDRDESTGLPEWLGSAPLRAEARLRGNVDGVLVADVQGDTNIGQKAREVGLGGRLQYDTVSGRLQVNLQARPGGELPPLEVGGTISGYGKSAYPAFDGALAWKGVSLSDLVAELPGVLGPASDADGTLAIALQIDGTMQEPKVAGQLVLNRGVVRGEGWEASGSATLPLRGPVFRVGVTDGGLLENLRVDVGPWSLASSRVEVDGNVEVAGRYEGGANLKLRVNELVVARDGEPVLVDSRADGTLRLGLPHAGRLSLQVGADLDRGHLVWKRHARDLSRQRLRLEGEVAVTDAALEANALWAHLHGLGSVTVTGRRRHADGSGTVLVEAEAPDLERLRSELMAYGLLPLEPWSRIAVDGRLAAAIRVGRFGPDGIDGVGGWAEVSTGVVSGYGWSVAARSIRVPFGLDGKDVLIADPGVTATELSGHVGQWSWAMDSAGALGLLSGDQPKRLADLRLEGVGFAAHDEPQMRAVERFEMAGKLQLSRVAAAAGADTETNGAAIDVSLLAKAGRGSVLWGRAFADMGPHPVSLDALVRMTPGQPFDVRTWKLRAAELVETDLSGAVARDFATWAVRGEVRLPSLEAPFRLGVAEPFGRSLPSLMRAKADGEMTLTVDAHRDPAGRNWVAGRLNLQAGEFSMADPPVEASGVSLDVPFLVGRGVRIGNNDGGLLDLKRLSFGGLHLADVRAPLRAQANALAFAAPVSAPALGGRLDIQALSTSIDESGGFHLAGAVAMQGLDLGASGWRPEWFPVEGRISGALGSIELDSRRLRTAGELSVDAFGGMVKVFNPYFSGLGSRVPSFGADVTLTDIDLERLTEGSKVGRVTGIAEGTLRDLVVAGGQPVSFEAEFRTVPRRGVSQRLSVDAIRQLTILGGAGRAGGVGFLQFFDSYRYASMGAKCSLRRDRFTLEGVRRHDGKEFLVVGSFMPPSLNVVSHSQEISFSELLRRVRYIGTVSSPKEKTS